MRQRHTVVVIFVGFVGFVVSILALAGCSAGGGAGAGASSTVGEAGDYPGVAVPEGVESAPEEASDLDAATDSAADRQVISEGSVSITADDPIEAADRAVGIVEGAGGRIDSRTEQPATDDDDDPASANLVVRIPASELTATLGSIGALGDIEQSQLDQTDVTAQTLDLGARITALTTSTDRLTALLAAATTTDDLIEIERTLSERQGELESLQAQQRGLADRVTLATVTISFGSEETAPVDSPDTFLSGLATGWDSLTGFVGALLVAIGVSLPWLLILALIASIVLLVIRRRRPSAPAAATMDE